LFKFFLLEIFGLYIIIHIDINYIYLTLDINYVYVYQNSLYFICATHYYDDKNKNLSMIKFIILEVNFFEFSKSP